MSQRRSESELIAAAEHIGYEWAMLLGARETNWHKLTACARSFRGLANSHSRTEIMRLHIRTLYEFLVGKRCCADDIQAEDFLEGHEKERWKSNRDKLASDYCPGLTADRHRLNKRLFHLSYDREKLPQGWDPDRGIKELADAFLYFRKRLTENRKRLFDEGIRARSEGPFPFLS